MGVTESKDGEIMQRVHDNGYNEGYHDGYADGQEDCFDRMKRESVNSNEISN